MTTAEFIIGHSAYDAEDRKQEARKVLWALLAALVIHLLIGYGLAVYGGLLYTPFSVVEEDKPVELSFVDLTTPAPKELPYLETSRSKESVAEPKRKDFQSNANSIAASEVPASGQTDLPSQAGKDRRGIEFENQDYVLAIEGAQPQPSVAAQATPQSQTIDQPPPLIKSQELAISTSKETPAPARQPTAKPAQEYKRSLTKVRVSGDVSNPGPSSVNASATALGRYTKAVWNLIVMRADNYFGTRGENAAYGSVDIEFVIERTGRVRNVTLVRNTSNEVFANIMVQAVTDTPLPPFPDELVSTFPEGFQFDAGFDFIPDNSVRLPR